jgi:hypothetical protein
LNSSRIDNILQRANLALPEQDIIFLVVMEGYGKPIAKLSFLKKIYLYYSCFLLLFAFIFGSAVWNFMF